MPSRASRSNSATSIVTAAGSSFADRRSPPIDAWGVVGRHWRSLVRECFRLSRACWSPRSLQSRLASLSREWVAPAGSARIGEQGPVLLAEQVDHFATGHAKFETAKKPEFSNRHGYPTSGPSRRTNDALTTELTHFSRLAQLPSSVLPRFSRALTGPFTHEVQKGQVRAQSHWIASELRETAMFQPDPNRRATGFHIILPPHFIGGVAPSRCGVKLPADPEKLLAELAGERLNSNIPNPLWDVLSQAAHRLAGAVWRPHPGRSEIDRKDRRLLIEVPEATLAAIDDYRFATRAPIGRKPCGGWSR